MQSGKLRHRIAVQAVVRTADGIGGFTEAWTTSVTLWAEVRAVSGNEYIQSGREESERQFRMWVRFNSGITTANRISWRGLILDILHVAETNKRNEMEILCEVRQ